MQQGRRCSFHKVFDKELEGICEGEYYRLFVAKMFDVMSILLSIVHAIGSM